MSDTDDDKFGGIEEMDVEGSVETRTVQTNGRINLPEKYLDYIGVQERQKVFVTAKDGELVINEASVDALRGGEK